MAGKQVRKLRQWAGEMITFTKEKTTLTDEFLELEHDVELRRIGVERLHMATRDYHRYLLKKRQTDALDEPQKIMPVETLGLVMINHGEEFGDESAFGQSLVKYGRAQLKLAALQEEYAKTLNDGYISHLERTMAEIGDYQAQRKKLDSRRLTLDAAATKASKQYKKEKEQKDAEDEYNKAKARYEEVSEDVQTRMIAIQENEVQQWHDLTAFLDVQLKFAMDYVGIVQDIKRDWINESSIKRVTPSRPRSVAHSFPQRSTTPTATRRPADSESDSDSPTTSAKARKERSNSKTEKDTLSRSASSARKRADSAGTASSTKRSIGVAGWASSAVSSVASIGRSGPKDGSRDKFATLDDEGSDDDSAAARRRRRGDDSDEDNDTPSRPASRGSNRTLSKRSPATRTVPLPPSIRPAPSQVQRKLVRALFDYAPSAGDELAFKAGEEVYVVSEVAEEWWMGEHADGSGRKGLFPVSYVEPVKRPPSIPSRPKLPNDSATSFSSGSGGSYKAGGGGGGGMTLQEKARRALADEPEPPPTPSDVDDDVFGDARYGVPHALSPTTARRTHHASQDSESEDDSDGQLERPLVARKASSGAVNGGKKAPPPPPPSRRGTTTPNIHANSNARHAVRSQSVGSLPSALLAKAAASSPFGGGGGQDEGGGRGSCDECGCDEFAQNKFKSKGYCNSCFHIHPPS
ncbi:BAR-domain-containing protein [Exidia glandulosa HHB12029]|uniref:BAR-domain-containing protein n=1 Tax=Exidia glandulosa HHB12029 TaxID=1314781 RepID=A0A165E546_EXIGL|nr:BAR-domain-containing protein [Exidia glandulosa HHB12029]